MNGRSERRTTASARSPFPGRIVADPGSFRSMRLCQNPLHGIRRRPQRASGLDSEAPPPRGRSSRRGDRVLGSLRLPPCGSPPRGSWSKRRGQSRATMDLHPDLRTVFGTRRGERSSTSSSAATPSRSTAGRASRRTSDSGSARSRRLAPRPRGAPCLRRPGDGSAELRTPGRTTSSGWEWHPFASRDLPHDPGRRVRGSLAACVFMRGGPASRSRSSASTICSRPSGPPRAEQHLG